MSKEIIWIFQTGEPIPSDNNSRGMRLTNLYKAAVELSNDVLIITSNFNHSTKKFREKSRYLKPFFIKKNLILINSSGYSKNISFSRLLDHALLSFNLLLFLIFSSRKFKKPTISFIGFPPIEWAFIACLWSKIRGIKSVVDIKDIWPDIFFENQKLIKKFIIMIGSLPYFILRHLTFLLSSNICLPTEFYASKVIRFHPNLKKNKIICPLVPPSDREEIFIDERKYIINNSIKIPYEFDGLSILFIGSLMATAYDFDLVFTALEKIKLQDNNNKIRILICGEGPIKEKLANSINSKKLKDSIFLLGWVNREEMYRLARYSDAAIAPYKALNNYEGHLPNKIADYLQLGLPIISSLKKEFPKIVKKYNIGFTFENIEDLVLIFNNLINAESNYLIKIKKNCKRLWELKYDAKKVYRDLIFKLKEIY